MEKKVRDKFGDMGWFKCLYDANGVYNEIVFGHPLTFDKWIDYVRLGDIFFDSGMYQGNSRNYSVWRANNTLWDSLIIHRY